MESSNRRLEKEAVPGAWTENQTIYFVNDDPQLKVAVTTASNCSISNTPYAPDDDYSFTVTLSEAGDNLQIILYQTVSTVLSSSTSNYYYHSTDGGKTWSERAYIDNSDPNLSYKVIAKISG